MHKFSIIAAVNDKAPCLEAFFSSLTAQTLAFAETIQCIVVDDGSTDDSLAICHAWRERYPENIVVLSQAHAGPGAARNRGLDHASHDWVTFIDADDFVDPTFFEQVRRALVHAEEQGDQVRLVLANIHRYYERDSLSRDAHPLRKRFELAGTILKVEKLGNTIHAEVAGASFHKPTLDALGLRFEPRLGAHGEDSQFVNAYLLGLQPADAVRYVRRAIYHHRQPLSETVTEERWLDPVLYEAMLPLGMIALLERARAHGKAPLFLQCAALYQVFGHLRHFVNRIDRVGHLSTVQRDTYLRDLKRCVDLIDRRTIESVNVPGLSQFYRVGLLHLTSQGSMPRQKLFLDAYDPAKSLVRARYYVAEHTAVERLYLDRARIVPQYPTVRQHRFFGQPFAYERIGWISVRGGDELAVEIANRPVRLSIAGRMHASNAIDTGELVALIEAQRVQVPAPTAEHETLRELAISPEMIRRFRGCWLLCDRDIIADDNAEHLYRYLQRAHPGINAIFALRRDSVDWARLEAEGFDLIDYGSMEYNAAVINAAYLISSHTCGYMLKSLDIRYYADLVRHRIVFLQHGVIKDDLSSGLSRQNMDMFVTSTEPEFSSIARDGTYRFSDKETVLTGLPRHDRLVGLRAQPEKVILVMPTWRGELSGALTGNGSEREFNPDFHRSQYAMAWRGFLASDELRKMTEAAGYRVVFCPHPNVVPYLDGFDLPPYIETTSQSDGSLQHQFLRASLLITDYSSVMFEMAVLRRPVIYYQFDEETFFSGGHTYEKGYFDYRTHGFGPVVRQFDQLITELADILRNEGAPEPRYLGRMNATFSFRDGRNCERVHQAILALDRPEIAPECVHHAMLDHARRLTWAEEWEDAGEAWRGLADQPDFAGEAAFQLAVVARAQGQFDEALASLKRAVELNFDPPRVRLERGRIAEQRGAFADAVEIYTSLLQTTANTGLSDLATIGLASVNRKQGRRLAAKRLLSSLDESDSWDLQHERAAIAMAMHEWPEAVDQLEPYRSSLPAKGMLMLAEASRMSGRPDQAREVLRHVNHAMSQPARVIEEARLAIRQENWKLAVKLWTALVESDRPPDDAPEQLARAKRMLGDLQDALAILNREDPPKRVGAFYREKALLSTKLARWQDAAAAWREVLKHSNGKAREPHLNLAEALMNLGDNEAALAHVEMFRKTGPETGRSGKLFSQLTNVTQAPRG